MENQIHFELTTDVVESLQVFSELLGKDINTMLNEALAQYFENEQKKLMEKGLADENAMTNLDYDEFWDGLDIEPENKSIIPQEKTTKISKV